EGQGASPGRAGRRPERRSAAPQADRRVSVHQVDLQLGRGHSIPLAGRLAVGRSALRRGALIIALISGLWADVDGARSAEELVVYSGRKEVAVKPIVEAFQKKTGMPAKFKTGTTTGLAHELIQEKARPRADVVIATGAGAMEISASNGVLGEYVSPEAKGLEPGPSARKGPRSRTSWRACGRRS